MFLAERMGWTIEYVMNLSLGQIQIILDSMAEMNKKRAENEGGKKGDVSTTGDDGNKSDSFQTLQMLSSMSNSKGQGVFGMTDKAKKALNKIYQNRVNKMKEKDGSK